MGISVRDFARREGCSDTSVRKALKVGRLHLLADGTIDPALVGLAWRKANRRKSAKPARKYTDPIPEEPEPPAPADLEELADQVVNIEGRAPYSLVEAERIKANYLGLLRQLQYDRESGAVAPIDEIAAAVASEYAIVRNRLLGLGVKLAPRIVLIREPERARALIDAEVIAALEGLTLDRGAPPESAP